MALEEIARSTRIASYYLEAIEAEDFGKLPGGVYSTSYIRQYARAICYNENALVDHYRARTEQGGTTEAPAVAGVEQVTRRATRLGDAMELFRRAKPGHPA